MLTDIADLIEEIGYTRKGFLNAINKKRSAPYLKRWYNLVQSGKSPLEAVEQVIEELEEDYRLGKISKFVYWKSKKRLYALREKILERESEPDYETCMKYVLKGLHYALTHPQEVHEKFATLIRKATGCSKDFANKIIRKLKENKELGDTVYEILTLLRSQTQKP